MIVTGKTKKLPQGWYVDVIHPDLRQKTYPMSKPQLDNYPENVVVELIPNTTEELDEQVVYTARIYNNLN